MGCTNTNPLEIAPFDSATEFVHPTGDTNIGALQAAHRSVRDLVASIHTWIANWNDDPKPFVWHKTADEILANLAAYCQRINDSGH